DPAVGEMNPDTVPVLLDALKGLAKVVVRGIDGVTQQPLQPVPGGHDLPQQPFADDAALAIDGDAFLEFDAEIARAGPGFLQRLQQARVGGDAAAAADKLDRGASEDADVPADPVQERRGEQARHRAANDDGTPAATARKRCHATLRFGPGIIAGCSQRGQLPSMDLPMSAAVARESTAMRRKRVYPRAGRWRSIVWGNRSRAVREGRERRRQISACRRLVARLELPTRVDRRAR